MDWHIAIHAAKPDETVNYESLLTIRTLLMLDLNAKSNNSDDASTIGALLGYTRDLMFDFTSFPKTQEIGEVLNRLRVAISPIIDEPFSTTNAERLLITRQLLPSVATLGPILHLMPKLLHVPHSAFAISGFSVVTDIRRACMVLRNEEGARTFTHFVPNLPAFISSLAPLSDMLFDLLREACQLVQGNDSVLRDLRANQIHTFCSTIVRSSENV